VFFGRGRTTRSGREARVIHVTDFVSPAAAGAPTFGAFAFEFVRRCLGEAALPFRKWTTEKLGIEMRRRMRDYSPNRINVLPALHASIARRHFLVSHRRYCPDPGQNYFEHVGTELSKVLIERADDFGIFRQFVPGK